MKDLNVINCTAYSNGVNSPLEYLNITTPAEFKVVMDLLCYYDSEKKTSTISRTGIARDTAMSVSSNVERALKLLRRRTSFASTTTMLTTVARSRTLMRSHS